MDRAPLSEHPPKLDSRAPCLLSSRKARPLAVNYRTSTAALTPVSCCSWCIIRAVSSALQSSEVVQTMERSTTRLPTGPCSRPSSRPVYWHRPGMTWCLGPYTHDGVFPCGVHRCGYSSSCTVDVGWRYFPVTGRKRCKRLMVVSKGSLPGMLRNPSSGTLPRLTHHKVRKGRACRGRGRATITAPTRQPTCSGRRPSTVAVGLVTRTYFGSPLIAALVPMVDACRRWSSQYQACFVGRGQPHFFTSFKQIAYPRVQGERHEVTRTTGLKREGHEGSVIPLCC